MTRYDALGLLREATLALAYEGFDERDEHTTTLVRDVDAAIAACRDAGCGVDSIRGEVLDCAPALIEDIGEYSTTRNLAIIVDMVRA